MKQLNNLCAELSPQKIMLSILYSIIFYTYLMEPFVISLARAFFFFGWKACSISERNTHTQAKLFWLSWSLKAMDSRKGIPPQRWMNQTMKKRYKKQLYGCKVNVATLRNLISLMETWRQSVCSWRNMCVIILWGIFSLKELKITETTGRIHDKCLGATRNEFRGIINKN